MDMRIQYAGVALLTILLIAPWGYIRAQVGGNEVESRRVQLQQELDRIESEIKEQQVYLDAKQRERVSLERDVDILKAQIQKSRLAIQARDLSIQRLTGEIGGKNQALDELSAKMLREKDSLAQLIRKTNEIDQFSLVEVALGNQNISAFFEDVDSFDSIKSGLQQSFRDIEQTKGVTKVEKQSLEDKRAEEQELRSIQNLEKKKIEQKESEVKEILDVTKGQEAVYQKIVNDKQKSAAQIRAELFTLRGSTAIPFEKALDLANLASGKTGVRPAVILGVIAEESNLGENVGTGNWIDDMHPTRDRPVFEEITKRLGLDPNLMPVSKKPWYGWGGAMGPAQFIPSTWVLYEERIGKITGHVPPNPWDPGDAFMASGLLMSDNGADRGTREAERLAALRYFAGWKNATNPSYAFYGDEVMALADKYQGLIDILAGS